VYGRNNRHLRGGYVKTIAPVITAAAIVATGSVMAVRAQVGAHEIQNVNEAP
jgi:hypothetical protein